MRRFRERRRDDGVQADRNGDEPDRALQGTIGQVSQNSAIWPRPAAVPAIPGPRCDGDDVIGLQRMLHAQQKTETENAEHASPLVSDRH